MTETHVGHYSRSVPCTGVSEIFRNAKKREGGGRKKVNGEERKNRGEKFQTYDLENELINILNLTQQSDFSSL